MSLNNMKLGVDVVRASKLKLKGGKGSNSSYVELFFDGQRYRTSVKDKDCSPVWEESFYFSISDPSTLRHLNLEAYVYSTIRGGNTRSLLGKVSVCGISFLPHSDAIVSQYSLKNGRIFSRVRGEMFLKVYITDNDNPSINSSTLLPSLDSSGKLMHEEVNPIHSHKPHHGHSSGPVDSHQSTKCEIEEVGAEAMEADATSPKIVKWCSNPVEPVDIALKETLSYIGDGTVVGDKRANTHDLVERMDFLYVNVVKSLFITESPDLFVEVRVGKYKGVTKHIDKNQDPEWNIVFAFSKQGMQDSELNVEVKYRHLDKDECVGIVRFDLNEVPMRVPPNSPLTHQWHHLEDSMGEKIEGELKLAVWTGTQADAAFYDAWHFDDAIPVIDLSASTHTQFRPKVYHAPTLWYARVTVIEAQDLQPNDRTRFPVVYVKAQMGRQMKSTKTFEARTLSPIWNDDLFFVVAEPFEGHVVLTVGNNLSFGQDEILGSVTIPIRSFDMRADDQATPSRWYNLEKPLTTDQRSQKENFCSRLHLRLCLDGGYHVLDGSIDYSGDLRPTAKRTLGGPHRFPGTRYTQS